jgi:hypothetical protein
MKENTDDGASLFKRNAEKVKQRKLKRAKRREDRRKYGVNKKRRAENKADAAAKRKALAQAAIVGGDSSAGQAGSSTGTGSINSGTFSYTANDGGSMKNISMAVPAKKLVKIQNQSAKGFTPGGKKHRSIVGENTSAVRKDKKGKPYSLLMENAQGLMKGDTIRPGKAPMVGNYIMGGDYKVKDIGNKNYKITGSSMYNKKDGSSMYDNKKGPSMYGKKEGSSMNAYQDKEASMDDYSHEKKLKADGRYEAAKGKMANAKNDFDHAHALKKDAHHDAKGRHAILKHMKKF